MTNTWTIPNCPGYAWEYNLVHHNPVHHTNYLLKWEPVKNVYPPPILHPDVRVMYLNIPRESTGRLGRVIGKDGCHLKEISTVSGAPYIFYRKDTNQFEIWGDYLAVQTAYDVMFHWVARVLFPGCM